MASISTTRCRSGHPPSHTPSNSTSADPPPGPAHGHSTDNSPSAACPAAGVRRPRPAARLAVGAQAGGPAAGDARPDPAAGQADVSGRRHRLPVRQPFHHPALHCDPFLRNTYMRASYYLRSCCKASNGDMRQRSGHLCGQHPWTCIIDARGGGGGACSIRAAMNASSATVPRRLNSYWLGWSPSTFYRVYSIEVAALMGVRWIVYRLKRRVPAVSTTQAYSQRWPRYCHVLTRSLLQSAASVSKLSMRRLTLAWLC